MRFHSPGGPEVLSYEDAPNPSLGPGEALVKVKACGVNRIDIWTRSGRYAAPLPHILGADVAGEVASVYPGVTEVRKGDPVIVYPVLYDGTCHFCQNKQFNRCVRVGLLGTASDGGYAEFIRAPAADLVNIGELDFKTAASLPVNFGTTWNGLASRAGVGPGDIVLVWAPGSGVGYAAIEISKFLGARVIATSSSDEKLQFAKTLGADFAINYKEEDLVERVSVLTEGLGVSAAFDQIGGETWGKSLACLRKGGRMISFGLTSGATAEIDVGRVYRNELGILGSFGCLKEDLVQVLSLASKGILKPRIFREMPLQSAREAHEILQSRKVQGKILLIP
ncbi:MAG: zinc-binding dehydrogenase [Thaumarchaeota archaeon]|nr:zinc-binding dehydrogenase [Nitrososphaerota archaeon]